MIKYNNDDSTNLDLRFLIPSKAAGIIIGKGGENVKELRERFNLKINIPDSTGPERIIHLSGRNQPVYDALEIILDKIKDCIPACEAEYYSNNGRSRWRYRSRGDDENGLNGYENNNGITGIDLRMLIHQSLAGSIIGRGGERIRELREQVNLRILNLYQMVCPNSTDRVTQMVGDQKNVLKCVKNITDLLQSQVSHIRNVEQPYDARNYDESQVLSYGGWLSKLAFKNLLDYGPEAFNSGATVVSNRRNQTNSSYSSTTNMSNSGGGGTTMSHHHQQQQNSQPSYRQQQQHGGGPNINNDVLPGMRRDNQHLSNMDSSCLDRTVKTIQVSVPNSYMGAIMGRGGTRIRSIRDESGAEIRVYEPDKNGGDRIIDITGNQDQISYAQHLLKSCVLTYHDKK